MIQRRFDPNEMKSNPQVILSRALSSPRDQAHRPVVRLPSIVVYPE